MLNVFTGVLRPAGRLCCASLFLILSLAPARAGSPAAAVIETYSDIAEAAYADAHIEAQKMRTAIEALLTAPSEERLAAARQAWRDARVPYMQTEVFRFGNKIVDDWEGKVNAWPLDEGLIDYVADPAGTGENEFYAVNVIANTTFKASGKTIDASQITKELLVRHLHEAGGIEANVATGYHAIEFLLWGQDLNGTGPGAGTRPATDFDIKNCTGGNCDRRAEYLQVATDLLIDQLAWMKGQWSKVGFARTALTSASEAQGLAAIFTGLGSLTYGELAGERMKLGLMIHDPEEEHDCFSDNTHAAHFFDLVGIRNVYLGQYERGDGTALSGPSVSDLVKEKSAETDAAVRAALDDATSKMTALFARAEAGEAYDQMIGEDNAEGNAVVQAAIDSLIVLAKSFEKAIATLGLEGVAFQGSDSLDSPSSVNGASDKGEL